MKLKYAFAIWLVFLLSFAHSFSSPYVILISFDGFRWDYLNRNLTPNINSFFDSGVKALSLMPCYPSSTFPNHLSIITGKYPQNHGIISNNFFNKHTGQKYSIRDSSVTEPFWYLGEAFWETARRQAIVTASFFWPGSEISLEYRRPNYYVPFNPKIPYIKRIDSVVSWLSLPYQKRPKFITLYFEETDNKGHNFGPNSEEVNKAIFLLDSLFGYFVQRLRQINFLDSVNIIIVSDHGMAEIEPRKVVKLWEIIDTTDFRIYSTGYIASIESNKGNLDSLYLALKHKYSNFDIYKREDVPKHFHFSNNQFIGDYVIIPNWGWSVASSERDYVFRIKGNHGYDNFWLDMHGIFLARGPAFKVGYQVGTLKNIDIYPLLCKIFGIIPRQDVDGKFEDISFILKQN